MSKKTTKITAKEVEYASRLARIKMKKGELEKFVGQFQEILGFIDQLSEVETGGIKPVSQVTGKKNSIRKDKVISSLPQSEVANDPSGYFIVPKVID